MNRNPTILLAPRAPTSLFFSAADEDLFLRTGVIHCTGTQPPRLTLHSLLASRRAPLVVRDAITGRHVVVAAMNG